MRLLPLASAALACLLCAVACGGADLPPRNVVLIVIDTLRADALGLYGSEFATSPEIDALGRESVVFDRAWAQGTYTPSSFLSYMTSTHVRTHGWDYNTMAFPPGGICGWRDLETLPEVLARHGFRREAWVANPVLHPKSGFPRGFETWNDLDVAALAERHKGELGYAINDVQVVAGARRSLSAWQKGARHLLYLHLMTPHLPLEPSEEARKRFGLEPDFAPGGRLTIWQVDRWKGQATPARREMVKKAYRAGVFDGDRYVGEILSAIDAAGQRDDTIVVLLADHGEELWEHDAYGHERGVWEALVHVPLLIRSPGLRPARVEARAVQLIDLGPTLLQMLGVEEQPASWQGQNLFDETSRRGTFSQRLLRVAVTLDGRSKGGWWAGNWSFFDLRDDPTEQRVLQIDGADWVPLRRPYGEWKLRVPIAKRDWGDEGVGMCASLSDVEERQRSELLRALGYVE